MEIQWEKISINQHVINPLVCKLMLFKKHSLCSDKIPLDMLKINIIKYLYCENSCAKIALFAYQGNHK